MGGDHLEDPDVDGRIFLKLIFKKCGRGCGLHSSGSGQRSIADFYEDGSELSDSIKGPEFR
jgi:hypothetical protein